MIPLTRPTLPKLQSLEGRLKEVLRTGQITNGKYVREFEKECQKILKVKYVVAVDHGTSALVLAIKALDLKGEVILPSFTFTSGGHSLLWCGLTPVFSDIDPQTLNLDPSDIEKRITKKTSAILATHVFGNPCLIKEIERIAKKHKLKVIYDAAHAFGSLYYKKPVACFGDVSCFSLTPTKILTTGEGGLIATNNYDLAKKLTIGRNNGDSFEREEEFLGLTARMTEIQGILGLENIKLFKKNLLRRLKLTKIYQGLLKGLPLSFQKVTDNCLSVYKDFVILTENQKARDSLLKKLKENKIEAKAYFYPPLHLKKVYRGLCSSGLKNTEDVSSRIISLPFYSQMPIEEVKIVCRICRQELKKE